MWVTYVCSLPLKVFLCLLIRCRLFTVDDAANCQESGWPAGSVAELVARCHRYSSNISDSVSRRNKKKKTMPRNVSLLFLHFFFLIASKGPTQAKPRVALLIIFLLLFYEEATVPAR